VFERSVLLVEPFSGPANKLGKTQNKGTGQLCFAKDIKRVGEEGNAGLKKGVRKNHCGGEQSGFEGLGGTLGESKRGNGKRGQAS